MKVYNLTIYTHLLFVVHQIMFYHEVTTNNGTSFRIVPFEVFPMSTHHENLYLLTWKGGHCIINRKRLRNSTVLE